MGVAALASMSVYAAVYIPGQATLWTQGTSLEAMNEKAHEGVTDLGTGEDVEVPAPPRANNNTLPTPSASTRLTTIAEAEP